MTREDAKEMIYKFMQDDHDLSREETDNGFEMKLINEIYDDFENRTCETCSKNISFECEIYNKLPFGQDEFGCIKWSKR